MSLLVLYYRTKLKYIDPSIFFVVLFSFHKEKELCRQQAEILKHQVGIDYNFVCHLNLNNLVTVVQ